MERLRNSNILEKEKKKKKIGEFVSDLKVEHSIGMQREYYYITRLRKIASLIPDKFLDPSEAD
ncbi:MAG: hypothetical protein QXV17_09895 [Candidatus Micrarchaeaceae archaeon]